MSNMPGGFQNQSAGSNSLRAKLQAFGSFLTKMVLPNIGAFIAWGIVTALFIETGWLPNEHLSKLVGPAITYLLPLLLAHTGGKMVGGKRGGVIGAAGTIGLIVGADIPMFLGAMIAGPLGGWIIKKFDDYVEGHVPAGFEMLVENFSLGILGFGLMILSYLIIGPVISSANNALKAVIQALVDTGMLPLLSIINEPAKVLFLNNVIDQGIYYPLGMQKAAEVGKSIYFTVASSPGPGLGLLLAYSVFGQGNAKRSAPGAIIIHFFGGIHELYFPYVLMNPVTILGMIAGGMSGIATFQLFDVGLVAGPSPGSIFAYLGLTPKGNFLGIISGVLVGAAVSFVVTSIILQFTQGEEDEEDDFEESVEQSKSMKSEAKQALNSESNDAKSVGNVNKIAFACDAGAGSSAMGATTFKKKLKKQNLDDIEVDHYSIEEVPEDADIIVVHKNLQERVEMSHKDKRIVPIETYIGDSNLEKLLDELKANN